MTKCGRAELLSCKEMIGDNAIQACKNREISRGKKRKDSRKSLIGEKSTCLRGWGWMCVCFLQEGEESSGEMPSTWTGPPTSIPPFPAPFGVSVSLQSPGWGQQPCAGTELGLQCPHLGVVPAVCPLRGLGRSPGWALVIAAAVQQSIVGPGSPSQLCEKRKEYKN